MDKARGGYFPRAPGKNKLILENNCNKPVRKFDNLIINFNFSVSRKVSKRGMVYVL